MHRRVDPDPAVQTTFSVNTLDKTTRTADNAINWQPHIISIRKDTFNPVINLKGGIACYALGFSLAPNLCIVLNKMGRLNIRDLRTILFCRFVASLCILC